MKRRFFGVILSVVLAVGLLPANLAAGATVLEPANDPVPRLAPLDLTGEVSYRDNHGNTTVSDASIEDIGNSGEGWAWNASSRTLTLSGARIVCTLGTEGIRLPADATLYLEEGSVNLVRSCDGNDKDSPYANAAVTGEGSLILTGTGTLFAAGGSTYDTATASYGLFLSMGDLTVEGGDWTFLGGETGTPSTHGISLENGSMEMSAGTLTAKGGNTTIGGNSYGILVNGQLDLSGGEATGLGGTASWTSRGLLLGGNLVQSGGVLNGFGGTALETGGDSAGLYVMGSVNLNNPAVPGTQDGKLNLMGGSADTTVALDMTLSDVNVYGGQVFLSAGEGVDLSLGVRTQGTIYFTGGTIVAQATPGAALSQALNQPASFGTSDMSIVYPTTLPPGDSAYEQPFNVYAPEGSLAFRSSRLSIGSETASFGNLETDGFNWDSTTKTLTLGGLCLATSQNSAIVLPAGAVVQTAADTVNIAKLTADSYNADVLIGEDLELMGQGRLMLLAGRATLWSEALYIQNGNLTVTSGDLLAIGSSGDHSLGIHVGNGTTTFNGGTVLTAGGDSTAGGMSCGINSEETIAIGPNARVGAFSAAAYNNSMALVAEGGGFEAAGGSLLACAGYSSGSSIAVKAGDGDMTVTGGVVKALSGGCQGYGYGIDLRHISDPETNGSFHESAGLVFAAAGGIGARNYAINCEGNFYQTGGQAFGLGARPGGTESYSFGVLANTATLDGGFLTASGASAKYTTGLGGSLELLGGQTIATSFGGGRESNGVQGDSVTISGGELWAIAGDADFTSGAFVYGGAFGQDSGEVYLRSGDSAGGSSHGVVVPIPDGSIRLSGGRLEAQTLETVGDGEALYVLPDLSLGGMTLRSGGPSEKHVVYLQSCTADFDVMGGTPAIPSATGDYGYLLELPEVHPTKTGYIFGGWQWYNPKTDAWRIWDFDVDRIAGDMTLKALWQKSASALTISTISKKSYTGSEIRPQPTVTDGSKTLVLGVDYTLSYANNVSTGKATLILTGIGNYAGKTSRYFYIVPRSLTAITLNLNSAYPDSSLRYRALKATWTPATGATGYLVKYRRSTVDTWSSAYVTSSSWSMLSSYSGAKYYVKVIPYVTVNGTKYFSYSYSPEKYVYTLKAPTVTLSKTGSTGIKVSWTNIYGETGYKVYRKTGSTGTYALVKTIVSTTATSWIDYGRTPGKTYYYKVKAYRTVGSTTIYGPSSAIKYLKR